MTSFPFFFPLLSTPDQHFFIHVIAYNLLVEVVCLIPIENNWEYFPGRGSFLVFGL